MKTIKKNVYYCDYCKKRNLSASHMKHHELVCTANPDRECHLCDENRDIKTFIKKLKSRFNITETEPDKFGERTLKAIWKGDIITLNEILDFTEGCPNCTFAILRQTKLNYLIFSFEYDYKAEINSWWSDKNKEGWEKERREMAEGYY